MENIFQQGNIKSKYEFDITLGKGAFGEVCKIINKDNGEEFACKVMNKSELQPEDMLAIQSEVEILIQLDHPNVVKLHEVWEDKTKFYMVMELMTGGELFDRIVERDHFSEKEASDIIRPLVDAINYCHKLGVAHRDLKPENLLFASKDSNSIIKISDFGLAKTHENNLMTTQCGTPSYVAPEIIAGQGYNQQVDVWSIGIILYIMLCGFPPFYDDDPDKLFEIISQGKIVFPSPHWDGISELAKDLIKKCLTIDPEKRISPALILKHPWVVGDMTPRDKIDIGGKIKEYQQSTKKKFNATKNFAKAIGKFNSILSKFGNK